MENDNIISNYNHSVTMVERKSLLISGIKKIDSFDDEEFLIETTMGYLVVKGSELELLKLDSLQGNISIKGIIKSFSYIDDINKKEKEKGLINKLFK